MALKFKGKTWIFGDNLDVDNEIVSFAKLHYGVFTHDQLGEHCMENVDPEFHKKVKKGDIMVAGTNFRCGHDHPHAPQSIQQCGISVVVAESFDENYIKNSVAIGLPLIELPGIKKKVKEGDVVEADLHAGIIENVTTGESIKFKPFPDFLLDMLEAGSLEAYGDKLIAEGKG
ncbi:MAG: 3-isopropylmalate dehydratase small subunit [Chloroflexi bacterium]|nr:3-isopropylmalate dehydratase small subunit [Chloroflexota bacterium]